MIAWKSGLTAGAALALAGLQPSIAAASQPFVSAISGIETQYVDASVRPQDDIYRYLNGKWLAGTQIPSDKPSYGTFNKLYDESQDQLRVIVESAAKNSRAKAGSEEAKIRDLYNSFMDESRVETLGTEPLAAEFARIDAIKSKDEIPALMAHLQQISVTVPFAPAVHLDNRDATKYIYDIIQDGLGLPDRDYYLKDDDATLRQIREKYQQIRGGHAGTAG